MDIKIDKKSETPAYRQIIEQITILIRDGKLTAGDRLPPERELASELGVARGTIKSAYEKLAANNIIEIAQGRGTFVSSGQYIMAEGRKESAIRILSSAISELDKLKFNPNEISSMFQILLAEQEQRRSEIHIAAIDCNPESLSIFDRQLRYISNVQLYKFLLDDLYRDRTAKTRLLEFDLIITTSTHYSEIIGIFPELRDRIIRAVVSPGHETIIEMARISPSSKVGIITQSQNFLRIIKSKLDDFQINTKNVKSIFEGDIAEFPDFIKDRNVLITPPECLLEGRKEFQNYFRKFLDGAGEIIRFDYQLERSSLLQIEEKISELIFKRRKN